MSFINSGTTMFKININVQIVDILFIADLNMKRQWLPNSCNGLWCWYWCVPVNQGMDYYSFSIPRGMNVIYGVLYVSSLPLCLVG